MFADAMDWDDIKQMPKFPKIDLDEPDTKTIELDQQDAIIQAIANPMDRAYILFMAREMVRPSEARALCWEDLDFKHDRVTIRRHFSLNQIRPTTKAKQIKILPLDGEVSLAIAKLPRHITSPFVFQKKGYPYSESWGRKLWKRISKSLNVEISLYQGTRHSSATELAGRMGVDLAQEFLHHSSRAMTKRYAKQSVENLRKGLRNSLSSVYPNKKIEKKD